MTRGRKKDLSIPASRALTQQRDYRARKAQYVTELEERCRKAEQENVELRRQLELARARVPVGAGTWSAEMAEASSELLQHLGSSAASIVRFQNLAAFGEVSRSQFRSHTSINPPMNGNLRPARFPSPTSFPPIPSRPYSDARPRGSHSPSCVIRQSQDRPEHRERSHSHSDDGSPSMESDCCGGFFDCGDITEKPEGSEAVDNEDRSMECIRTSEIRST